MIRTIVIDDESMARETIITMLGMYCHNVEVVAQACNVESGLIAIKESKPDLVLLDINMPDGSGFDLLSRFKEIDFAVVFVTAYVEYALRAFRFSAVDYIVKPLDYQELIAAVKKASRMFRESEISTKLDTCLYNLENRSKESKRLVIKTTNSIHVVDIQDIVRCEADRNYTLFHFVDQKNLLVAKTLKEYDELLDGYNFFRVHHSHLINLSHLKSYERREGGMALMVDGSSVPVANSNKDWFMKLLDNI
ncbi:MAG: response regulator transcription factor [Flavobacteriales bacterium]|nr:response regulator transcription factor [Flavobacteriales bacterium]